jgi:hypothetical protein
MRKIFKTFVCLLLMSFSYSQTYYKINGLTSVVGIPNVGFETSIGANSTFQLDVTNSFWKSINNKPFKLFLIFPEYRYFFVEKFKGFYIGTNVGVGYFKFQKWNYTNSNQYQEGFNYMVGGVIGYEKQLGNHFLIDFFIGGGNSQAFYRGYDLDTDKRYDLASGFNKSGEFIPYRGGVMIAYKF